MNPSLCCKHGGPTCLPIGKIPIFRLQSRLNTSRLVNLKTGQSLNFGNLIGMPVSWLTSSSLVQRLHVDFSSFRSIVGRSTAPATAFPLYGARIRRHQPGIVTKATASRDTESGLR
jgi:hypothetical protein